MIQSIVQQKRLVDRFTEWCFMLLSTLFQSYQSNSSHIHVLPGFSTVLGYEVSCKRTLPQKKKKKKPRGSSAAGTWGLQSYTIPLSQVGSLGRTDFYGSIILLSIVC